MRTLVFYMLAMAAVSANRKCFKVDEVNAASSLPWQVDNVDGDLVATKPKVVTGEQLSDLTILEGSPDYIKGEMKVAQINWCTENDRNSGRIVSLQVSLKPVKGYTNADYLTLN